jgi:hypothetical protein
LFLEVIVFDADYIESAWAQSRQLLNLLETLSPCFVEDALMCTEKRGLGFPLLKEGRTR